MAGRCGVNTPPFLLLLGATMGQVKGGVRIGGTLFTTVSRLRLTRGSAEEVARRVRGSFVPLLRELPGFRDYYLLEGGPDVLISIRVFDNADEALASNEIAADWMRDNVLEFVKGMPEVVAGNVLVAEARAAQEMVD
jgi:hypothetical protein